MAGAPVAVPLGVPVGMPLPAVPVAGLPPVQVPLGVPVGQAMMPPVANPAIPVGMPVGAPGNIPVGMPLAPPPASPAFNFTATTAPSAAGTSKATSGEDETRPRKKGSNSLLLVSLLGGACVAIAVVGGVLVYMRSSAVEEEAIAAAAKDDVPLAADGESNAGEATNPASNPEANPVASSEANPTLAVVGAPAATTSAAGSASSGASASNAAAAKESAEQLLRIKKIADWSPLHLPHMFTSKSARITITNAWLAADEGGRRVAVKAVASPTMTAAITPAGAPDANIAADVAPAALATSAEAPPAAPAIAEAMKPTVASTDKASPGKALALAEPAKYLFVEVKIANTSPKVLKYRGWNAATDVGAILATSDAVLPLAPRAATPSSQRQGEVDLAPGQTISDVLVFAAPADSAEPLRLALPQASLFANSKGFCAVEIPRQLLLSEPPPTVNNLAGGVDPVMGTPRPSTGEPLSGADLRKKIEADTAMLEQESAPAKGVAQPAAGPAAMPAAAPAAEGMKKEDKPPSIAELNKQFEASQPAAMPEGAKPAAPENPAPAVKP